MSPRGGRGARAEEEAPTAQTSAALIIQPELPKEQGGAQPPDPSGAPPVPSSVAPPSSDDEGTPGSDPEPTPWTNPRSNQNH